MWEETSQVAEDLLASGTMHDLHLVTPTEGCARVKAESKTAALAIAASFFPMFTNDVVELVPWDEAKGPVLEAVRQAAGQG